MTERDLRELQSLPLDIKIAMTKARIREWVMKYGVSGVYVSFSGGKDSTVLRHIVSTMFPEIVSVFVDTGLEYPEIRDFVKSCENVEIIKPELKFNEVIEKYGFPLFSKEIAKNIEYGRKAIKAGDTKKIQRYLYGIRKNKAGEMYKFYELPKMALDIALNTDIKVSSRCCDVMKKAPAKKYEKETGKHPIIATLCTESKLREKNWMKYGCNAFEAIRPTCTPLSFWTENDILQYIFENEIAFCSVYGKIISDNSGNYKCTGVQRTGCMFCCFGVHKEKFPNRFQIMKKTHPKQYEYCINVLGIGKVLKRINCEF